VNVGVEFVGVRVRLQQSINRSVGVGRRAGEVVVMGQRGHVGTVMLRQREQAIDDDGVPLGIACGVGQAETCCWDAGADGVGEGEPLVEVGVGGPGFGIADGRAEAVGFVAYLEIFELCAEDLGGGDSFVGGKRWNIGAEVDAVEAGPSSGFEECAQIVDGFGGDRVGEVGIGVAYFVLALRARRGNGGWSGLPKAVVRRIAAEAEDTVGCDGAKLRDQASVRGGEEVRFGELLGLVGEANEIRGNRGTGLLLMKGQLRGLNWGLRRGGGGLGEALQICSGGGTGE